MCSVLPLSNSRPRFAQGGKKRCGFSSVSAHDLPAAAIYDSGENGLPLSIPSTLTTAHFAGEVCPRDRGNQYQATRGPRPRLLRRGARIGPESAGFGGKLQAVGGLACNSYNSFGVCCY